LKQKKLLLLVMLFFCLSGLLTSQTFEDGNRSYKKANLARAMGETAEEQKALNNALQIFKGLTPRDNKVIIMLYLLSLKLNQPFSLEADLNDYVRNEYSTFPTLTVMKFYGDDKSRLLDKLNDNAKQNEQKALKLVNEAKDHARRQMYNDAFTLLDKAEKLWKITEIAALRKDYSEMQSKNGLKLLKKTVDDLMAQKSFIDAQYQIDQAKKTMNASDLTPLETNVKKKWAAHLLKEAQIEYKNGNSYAAVNKCNQAYQLHATKKALNLKQKYGTARTVRTVKPRRTATQKKEWATFFEAAYYSDFKLNLREFNYSGNSRDFAEFLDKDSVHAEPEGTKQMNYRFGIMKKFSPGFGLSIAVSIFSQPLKVFSNYQYDLEFYDASKYTGTGTMSDDGNISITAVEVGLFASLPISKNLFFNIQGGPTLFINKVDMTAGVGYGGIWSAPDYYFVEWFPYRYRINKSVLSIGANAGAEFEFKTNNQYSAYVGIQGVYMPTVKIDMELIEQRYYGQIYDGYWYTDNPAGLGNPPSYKAEYKMLHYRLNFGIRYYF